MIVNVIVILIILISGLVYSDRKSQFVDSDYNRKRYIKFVSFILILQSGLRNVAVGADTYAYYKNFEEIKNTSWQQIWNIIYEYYTAGTGKDPGYPAFLKVVQILITNYQIFLFLIAVFFFIALGSFIYKNTNKLNDAIFAFVLYSSLFYNFFSITGIRQTIATAATLFGYELIKKRKLIPFLILILLASTIHFTLLPILRRQNLFMDPFSYSSL
jgi:transmembrane protein EpsG